jgi:hypothetical protein
MNYRIEFVRIQGEVDLEGDSYSETLDEFEFRSRNDESAKRRLEKFKAETRGDQFTLRKIVQREKTLLIR